jgi:hypothetical protein
LAAARRAQAAGAAGVRARARTMSGSSRRLELRVAALQDAALCAASAPMMGSLEAARLRREVDRQFEELLGALAQPAEPALPALPAEAAPAAAAAAAPAPRVEARKGLSRCELAKARELAVSAGRSPASASPQPRAEAGDADARAE